MACSSLVTADNWHRTLKRNFPALLQSIDTENLLQGELLKREFDSVIINELWVSLYNFSFYYIA